MSSTNKTGYANLSKFSNTDQPKWIEDYNEDMRKIDSTLATHNTNKQDKLVSGTNIKTVNGMSLLGSGNVSITTSAYSTYMHNIYLRQNSYGIFFKVLFQFVSAKSTPYTSATELLNAIHTAGFVGGDYGAVLPASGGYSYEDFQPYAAGVFGIGYDGAYIWVRGSELRIWNTNVVWYAFDTTEAVRLNPNIVTPARTYIEQDIVTRLS